MTVAGVELVVPALTLRVSDIRPDWDAIRRYAKRAEATPVDRFILSGSTTRGDLLAVEDRARTLDLWLGVLPPERLLATMWCERDLDESERRGVPALAVLRALPTPADALRFLGQLPASTFVYSHPMYTPTVLDADLAGAAAERGCLPAGAKVAKIDPDGIAALRSAVGPAFRLWDGSSRRIRTSMAMGATGVVATPLSHLPELLPDVDDLEVLQRTLDQAQGQLDTLPDRPQRAEWLYEQASAVL
jgi:dihydrodipicolinate synthase/N-acetylneuraminate lyase